MGYGIVVGLDDQSARTMTPGEVGRSLFATVGTNPYPTTFEPVQTGPWVSLGAFHTTEPVVFTVRGHRLELCGPDRVDEGFWVKQLTGGDMHRMIKDAQRHPARYQRALSTAESMSDAVFGPDLLSSGMSVASVWWFYADALQSNPGSDPATVFTLGENVLRLVGTNRHDAAPVGTHQGALNKAGAVLSEDPVTLCWSGNRVCAPSGLHPAEHTQLFKV